MRSGRGENEKENADSKATATSSVLGGYCSFGRQNRGTRCWMIQVTEKMKVESLGNMYGSSF